MSKMEACESGTACQEEVAFVLEERAEYLLLKAIEPAQSRSALV